MNTPAVRIHVVLLKTDSLNTLTDAAKFPPVVATVCLSTSYEVTYATLETTMFSELTMIASVICSPAFTRVWLAAVPVFCRMFPSYELDEMIPT